MPRCGKDSCPAHPMHISEVDGLRDELGRLGRDLDVLNPNPRLWEDSLELGG